MISMPQIQSIRSRRRNGESIASIARSERVSEPTVRKYLRVDGLSVCFVKFLWAVSAFLLVRLSGCF